MRMIPFNDGPSEFQSNYLAQKLAMVDFAVVIEQSSLYVVARCYPMQTLQELSQIIACVGS